jgi:farnesyl diphosphate synthase
VRRSLREYGAAIGLAFQITDDILDATQSADTLGKNPSDAALGKSTYVAIYGLEEARGRAREEVDRALEALDRAGVGAPILRALARYVVERDR